MSASDKAENAAQKAEGKAKEAAGKAVGNPRLEAEGKGDRLSGDVKQAGENLKKTKDDLTD